MLQRLVPDNLCSKERRTMAHMLSRWRNVHTGGLALGMGTTCSHRPLPGVRRKKARCDPERLNSRVLGIIDATDDITHTIF